MFKNIVVFNMNRTLKITRELLTEKLADFRFAPCGPHDIKKSGFVSHTKGYEELFYEDKGQFLLNILTEEKILPAAVINDVLADKIEMFEENNGRKPKKTEKEQMKDQIIMELLPRAFSKHNKTQVWIDSVNGLIIVNSGSANKAEDTLALIRKALGSLPVTPLAPNQSPDIIMTEWVKTGKGENGLTPTDEVELKSSIDEGVVTSKKQDLQSDEILNHIESGKFVSKLSFDFEERMTLMLTSDLLIKKIKMSDIVEEKIIEDLGDDESSEAKFASEFFIYTSEISKLIQAVIKSFECETQDNGYNEHIMDDEPEEKED
jgi:recombination associated protein RdgC